MAAPKKTPVKHIPKKESVPLKKDQSAKKPGPPPAKTNISAVTNEDAPFLKEQTLVWLFTILSAAAVYVVIALIIQQVYHPDIAALKAAASKLLQGGDLVRPEPVEAALFRVAVIVLPLLLLGFYRFFLGMPAVKRMAASPAAIIIPCIVLAAIAAMIFFDFRAPNPFAKGGGDAAQIRRDMTATTNFDFYFNGLFLGNNLYLYAFAIAPAICCLFFLGIRRRSWDTNKTFNLVVSVIGYAYLVITIGSITAMDTFSFPHQSENKYDFSAVYYSMTQVYAGTPMLVNNFTNTYGLYPHFLNPLFEIIGLSIFNFSMVMGILLGLSFAFNFYVLQQLVRNKVILFLGMFTVLFFSFIDFKLVEHFDANFAFFPIRYFVPSLLMFLCTLYQKRKSALFYWIITFVMANCILWNPEFGLVSFVSWLLFNTYIDFYDENGRVNLKRIGLHWAGGLGMVIGAFLLFKGIIYLFYGASPDLGSLLRSIFIFGHLGFGMLPMHLVHPWNIAAITLMLGMTFAISVWYRKKISTEGAMVFLLTIVGTGFFFYFQGRSHNWNFAQSAGVSLMLLTILGDQLWARLQRNNVAPLIVLFVLFVYVISDSIIEIAVHADKLKELVLQSSDAANDAASENELEGAKDFVVSNTQPHEKIYVFSLKKYQDLFFDNTKRRSAFNPGFIDMFLNSEAPRLQKMLTDSSYSFFITPSSTYEPGQFASLVAMAATYKVKENKGIMSMMVKRKTKIPSDTFFRADSFVVHRKYTDDTNSVKARIADAQGIGEVEMAPVFSVQALFDMHKQAFTTATIVGNSIETNGFMIGKTLGSDNELMFGFNGMGYHVPVQVDGWLYVTMNVYPDHFTVYMNGDSVETIPLQRSYVNTDKKVCIGNIGQNHYYVGAISEVAIENRIIDAAEIKNVARKIQASLTGSR